MNTIQILIIAAVFVLLFAFMVHVLTKMRERADEIEKSIKQNEGIIKSIRKQQSIDAAVQQKVVPQINVSVPASPVSVPQTPKNVPTQGTFAFEAMPEEKKPVDPSKPKRKSPIAHSVLHHDDEFWLAVCREYQTLKHRNPNLSQADFVNTKADARIKIKTFNAKLHQLTTNGVFVHKPRTSKKNQ